MPRGKDLKGKALFRSTHGGSYAAEYRVWHLMKQRCQNPKGDHYGEYGGRGITVCDRWRNSYGAFIADMGPRPSPKHQIDRIDNDRGYEPDNCRWVTRKQNMRNQRRTRWATIDGERRSVREWCEVRGVSYGAVNSRIVKLKWAPERAILEPVLGRFGKVKPDAEQTEEASAEAEQA